MRSTNQVAGLTALVAFLSQGCGSSLVVTEDTDTEVFQDGGIRGLDAIDASDGREIPLVCGNSGECDDGDPCTKDFCRMGLCEFTGKEINLQPVIVPTAAPALDVALAPGFIYVAEGEGMVEIFDISNIALPVFAENLATAGEALAIDARGMGFAVAEGEAGVQTFSSPSDNVAADFQPNIDEVIDVGIGPRYAILSAFADGIYIADATSLETPSGLGELNTIGRALAAESDNDTCGFVADALGGALSIVFRSEEDGTPAIVGKILSEGRVTDVAVAGDTALMAEYGVGFSVVDLSDPYNPERLSRVLTASDSTLVSLLGSQTGVVAEKSGQVTVYDLRDPFAPVVLSFWRAKSEPLKMDTNAGLIAVALGEQGVAVMTTGCEEQDSL
ncbi:MAG: hypothetical protein GY854_12790 [Deltaproteobacteria bacterium]|nr:hypothetical protein [Deltaproteobacteria bacterium]